MVSPTLAFVETELGTGSGVLFDEWHLVTNAHVVWPFDEVRVVFPDGTELLDADVIHIDEIADLAIVDVSRAAPRLPEPVAWGDLEGLESGSELFLIGYPGEVEEYPQPDLHAGNSVASANARRPGSGIPANRRRYRGFNSGLSEAARGA